MARETAGFRWHSLCHKDKARAVLPDRTRNKLRPGRESMAANKGQKKILAILTALAGLLVALACFPQSVFEPDRPAQLKIDQLFVPALFNFEVGRDVEVSIEIKDQRGKSPAGSTDPVVEPG